jgi:carbon storage regulator CsrA
MLVLTRKDGESVLIGDEITLTVEDVCSSNSRDMPGTAVRLGFQAPRGVTIRRDNIRRPGCYKRKDKAQPAYQPKGQLVRISDAKARLRIRVPPRIPVCHNATPVLAAEVDKWIGGTADASSLVYRITCHQEDRITICNNIVIVALDFRLLGRRQTDAAPTR